MVIFSYLKVLSLHTLATAALCAATIKISDGNDMSKVSEKSILQHEKTYRDGIPKIQPNKVGTNDTAVPLWTPIPISFGFFLTRSYACYME